MNLFIDCEFNDPNETLMSLALVSEDGKHEFYEVLRYDPKLITDQWVVENVVPILNKTPISKTEFQTKLKTFLEKFPSVCVIADHPNDIGYLTRIMITGDHGRWFYINIEFQINTALSGKASVIMHNALSDARAIRDSHNALEKFEQ